MVTRIGLHVGLWALLLAAASPGCERRLDCGECPTIGSPQVTLGAVDGGNPADGGGVVATFPNPCAIDVDFGALPMGQGASATIQVMDVGDGALDLAQINPSLNAEFGVNYGTQQPIQFGEFAQFAVTFEASTPGTVSSSFTILTDGINSECPNDGGLGGSILTVALTGSASN